MKGNERRGDTGKGQDERARSDDSLGCKGEEAGEDRSMRQVKKDAGLLKAEQRKQKSALSSCGWLSQGIMKLNPFGLRRLLGALGAEFRIKGSILSDSTHSMLSDVFTCLILLMAMVHH